MRAGVFEEGSGIISNGGSMILGILCDTVRTVTEARRFVNSSGALS